MCFDEATSALDGDTESLIMKSISTLSQKKTIIMIAHRVTTLKGCDIIYILDKGKIVNSGSYVDLLNSDKKFKSLSNF